MLWELITWSLKEDASIFYHILSTNFLRKCIDISPESLYVNIGLSGHMTVSRGWLAFCTFTWLSSLYRKVLNLKKNFPVFFAPRAQKSCRCWCCWWWWWRPFNRGLNVVWSFKLKQSLTTLTNFAKEPDINIHKLRLFYHLYNLQLFKGDVCDKVDFGFIVCESFPLHWLECNFHAFDSL